MMPPLAICQCATLACMLEATAQKVGNVHRGADFADLTFTDFAASAVAITPAMDAAIDTGVGQAVRDAVAATRAVVATNTNLGMSLLIAPLAAVPRDEPLSPAAVSKVLSQLSADDCRLVYEAIRLAQPGGMGQVKSMDVANEPPNDLLAAMRLASDRDLVARQYVEDFRLVLDDALPRLITSREKGWSLTETIVHTHLGLIAQHGDSLIARKCGPDLAAQAAVLAQQTLDRGQPGDDAYYEAVSDFDFWLRADGNRRNPGTTADILAAALFAALRDGHLPPPWR